MVEYDEAFVEKAVDKKTKANLKAGRGCQKQSTVAVMAESTVLKDINRGKLEKSCRYIKMKKIKNL